MPETGCLGSPLPTLKYKPLWFWNNAQKNDRLLASMEMKPDLLLAGTRISGDAPWGGYPMTVEPRDRLGGSFHSLRKASLLAFRMQLSYEICANISLIGQALVCPPLQHVQHHAAEADGQRRPKLHAPQTTRGF